jgi:hypothetical protein
MRRSISTIAIMVALLIPTALSAATSSSAECKGDKFAAPKPECQEVLTMDADSYRAKDPDQRMSEMDVIVYGRPVFLIDGRPFYFVPPVVAAEDAKPVETIKPIPYLPLPVLRGPYDPIERIDAGHEVFGR